MEIDELSNAAICSLEQRAGEERGLAEKVIAAEQTAEASGDPYKVFGLLKDLVKEARSILKEGK